MRQRLVMDETEGRVAVVMTWFDALMRSHAARKTDSSSVRCETPGRLGKVGESADLGPKKFSRAGTCARSLMSLTLGALERYACPETKHGRSRCRAAPVVARHIRLCGLDGQDWPWRPRLSFLKQRHPVRLWTAYLNAGGWIFITGTESDALNERTSAGVGGPVFFVLAFRRNQRT